MRRFLIVIGVLAVLGGLGGVAAFVFTGGAVTAADEFFQAIAKDGPDAALARTDPAFQREETAQSMAAMADQLGLRGYRSASWSSRSISGGKAELEGTLSLGDNGTLPVQVTLVKDGSGTWRVLAFHAQRPGAHASAPTPPDDAALRQLVLVTLTQLVEAIKLNDFRGLFYATSSEFRAQSSVEKLAAEFQPFVAGHLDLTRATTNFTLTGAPAVEHEVMTVRGTVRTDVQPWYFEFGYVQEQPGWLPISIGLSSRPPE